MTVLVVEDEPLIRENLAFELEDAGYRVLQAAHADEAIRIMNTRPEVRLIITDIDMPGSMDGLKLAHAVRERWPPTAIVVCSGRHRPADTSLPEKTVFVAKPFLFRQISEAIQKLDAFTRD